MGHLGRRRRDQRGLAAILICIMMVSLLVIAGMVIDFGLLRFHRQINKSTADNAVAAGIRGFSRKDGMVYAFKGVCAAIGYLKTNEPALAGLPAYTPCSNNQSLVKTCVASDITTHASYVQTLGDYTVTVKAPYTLPDPSFPEDAYGGETGDIADKCLQLGVVITQRHDPGLGKLAVGTAKLPSTIRSVGRVKAVPGGRAPALLLLDRHNCLVLSTGTNTNSANQNNFIRVYGAGSGGSVQPGTIHADSDGSTCKSNETIFQGKRDDGIVAYAAPDLSEHGIISSYGSMVGVAPSVVSDGPAKVYGSSATDEAGAGLGTKYPPSPLGLITRSIVDNQYLTGVTNVRSSAQAVFNGVTAATAASQGYSVLSNCNSGNQTAINNLALTKVYVDCSTYRGDGTFHNATTIVFKGDITQQASTLMPKATAVFIAGGNTAANAAAVTSTGNPFRMHYNGNSSCPNTPQSESAILVVKSGGFSNNNGWFQACNTFVLMMSGYDDGCLPAVGVVVAPTTNPCSSSTKPGNGYLGLGGGGSGSTVIDWTAPNKYDADMALLSDAQKQAAWNLQEDLSFWSETWSDASFKMAGGSGLHLVGVFMTPNADPFTVTGGGQQTLTNAQYIATRFQVDGGASLKMVVDPNNTVTLPTLSYFLVR